MWRAHSNQCLLGDVGGVVQTLQQLSEFLLELALWYQTMHVSGTKQCTSCSSLPSPVVHGIPVKMKVGSIWRTRNSAMCWKSLREGELNVFGEIWLRV